MSKLSPAKNNMYIYLFHYFIDPWLVMLCLGALGNMRSIELLKSLSYFEVFLASAAVQLFMPIMFVRNVEVLPSKDEVEI